MQPSENSTLIDGYRLLLEQIDSWFVAAIDKYSQHIRCASGCSGCCRGLFDITLLDAALLRQGCELLSSDVRAELLLKAQQRLSQLQGIWPELAPPFMLNHRPAEEWHELMPEDDETPCVLLDSTGRCLVYAFRPMTCRLHGLPHVDASGEIMDDTWCTENFTDTDPLALPELAAPFKDLFRQEVLLGRELSRELLGEMIYELDTFIPLALLVDYNNFDMAEWWINNRTRLLQTT